MPQQGMDGLSFLNSLEQDKDKQLQSAAYDMYKARYLDGVWIFILNPRLT